MSTKYLSLLQQFSGFYGKIPALGDFVSRGLKTEIVNTLDSWLTDYMSALPLVLPNYQTDWESLPIWRFITAQSIFSEHICVGLLASSYDSVGRLFPVVILYEVLSEHELQQMLCYDEHMWLFDVEDIIYAARYQHLEADGLFKAINRLSPSYLKPVLSQSSDKTLAIWSKCLEVLQSTGSLWWYEGKQGTTYCHYSKLPKGADFVKHYQRV